MAEEKKDKKEKAEHGKKGHGFHHSHFEHHKDGSITVHHEHENPAQSVKHAVSDLDGAHDSMEDHLREPEPNENEPEPAAEPGAPGGAPMPQGQ